MRVVHRLLTTLLVLAATAAAGTPARAQQPGVEELLARVGERIADFYRRAQHVVAIEKSTVQPIDLSRTNQGFARVVESELRVEIDGVEEARVIRDVRKVNGRPPRERDIKRDGCTDPTAFSDEPLAFLLPKNRSDWQFKSAGRSSDRNRQAFLVDFASVIRNSRLELIEDPGGHDNCFDWTGPIASRGRIWVDAKNYDVLRIERSVGGPTDVRVPLRIQRKHNLDFRVIIVREDTTIRYRTVAFTDPEETLLLPESIEQWSIVQGGLQSTRRSQYYSGYRRFVGDSRVLDPQ